MTLRVLARFAVILVVCALAWGAPVAAQEATPPGAPGVDRTLVYRDITAWTDAIQTSGESAPLLSDDGQHVAYTISPGSGDPATPNQIFVMNADGSGQQQVDSYTTLCYCASSIDLSADGSRVVSTDSVQLRIADGAGGRELIALNSNEIGGARISGDGNTVIFTVYRDTSVRASSPEQPVERGLWAIDADGGNLRQVVNPRQLEALGLPPSDFFGQGVLDLSSDGQQIVFATYHDGQSGGVGQGLFAVGLDGSGLRELVGRVGFVSQAAISGDGATVAYTIVDESNVVQVGVMPVAGSSPRVLVKDADNLNAPGGAIPGSGDRMRLSQDGGVLLLGSSGVIADTATGDLLSLGIITPSFPSGTAQLVGSGLFRATMDGTASRFLFLTDATVGTQLAVLDIDPADPGDAPNLGEPVIDPAVVQVDGGSYATVQVAVATADPPTMVAAFVLDNGLIDGNLGVYGLADDGSHGDASAGDGVFTHDGVGANCCAQNGPRTVRVFAQAQGANGRRVATAVDFGPFAVTGADPTPTPAA